MEHVHSIILIKIRTLYKRKEGRVWKNQRFILLRK